MSNRISNPHEIPITREEYANLKAAYDKAASEGKDEFTYAGTPVLVQYVKYLLEYMEDQLHISNSDADAETQFWVNLSRFVTLPFDIEDVDVVEENCGVVWIQLKDGRSYSFTFQLTES